MGVWGVLDWFGGCSAMAEYIGSVCGASSLSTGPEVVAASEVGGGTASPWIKS